LADSPLRLGYVPLTDAAPLLVADALNLFARHGVRVALSAEPSWATLRDKLAFGALDGAHLLGPMAIAAAVGAGGLTRRLAIGCGLARNGNAVVLSHALAEAAGAGDAPLAPDAFARAVRQCPEPPVLAVVFAHSSHHYLLRHWLAAGGLDPDADVRLTVVPPPRCAEALATGAIDGFCAGEP
jgi:two-component system, oxyanion-binding sensor